MGETTYHPIRSVIMEIRFLVYVIKRNGKRTASVVMMKFVHLNQFVVSNSWSVFHNGKRLFQIFNLTKIHNVLYEHIKTKLAKVII